MRRIALINQKGGVGKTTTAANLGAALALAGKRVVVVDLDPQANLTLYLGIELPAGAPSSYRVLTGEISFAAALRETSTPNLRLLPTDIHLSGAELELSATPGREKLMRAALDGWIAEHKKGHRGEEPADYVLFDCPPSLGLLSLNALAAADEVFLVVQTQFLALQGMSKLVEVIDLVKQRLHPGLKLSGIVPCMYDSRMRLAREVLAELRRYFPTQVFRTPISANVKLAESPSFAKTIFEYAPDSIGARDFASLSHEVLTQEVLTRPAGEAEPARKKLDLGEALRGASQALTPPSESAASASAAKPEAAKPLAKPAGRAAPTPKAVPRPVSEPARPTPVVTAAPSPAPVPTKRVAAPKTPPPANPPPSTAVASVKPKRPAVAPVVEPVRASPAPLAPAPTTSAPRKRELAPAAATTSAPAASRKAQAPAPAIPLPEARHEPPAPAPRALAPAAKDSARATKAEPRRESPAPSTRPVAPAVEAKPEGVARRSPSKPAASG